MPDPAPLDPSELATLRAEHFPIVLHTDSDEDSYCDECSLDWPCDHARLLASLEQANARNDEACNETHAAVLLLFKRDARIAELEAALRELSGIVHRECWSAADANAVIDAALAPRVEEPHQ